MLLNLIISLALFVATTCSASIITFVGENSTNAASWRTPSDPKTINPAGNNIYGNNGYVMFATTSTAATATTAVNGVDVFHFNSTLPDGSPWTTLNVPPSYVSAIPAAPGSGFNSVQTASGFLSMDNPSGGLMKSGFAFASAGGNFKSLFTFTVNGSVPSTFAVGLFFNNSSGNFGASVQAEITDGTPQGTATGSRTVFGNIDALFFTISGATPGDVFTIEGLASNPSLVLDISGITFDPVTPEPTTLGGCAIAALVFLWLGRRSK
jgi:hypothetical protein